MLRDEAVTRIQRILGFRSDLATEIVDALKDTQVELERGHELPWFLLSDVVSLATVADTETVAFPADFLREWEDGHLWYYVAGATTPDEDSWTPLEKLGLDQMRIDYPGVGVPQAYAVSGLYWRIGPTPDAVYTLKTIYYIKDTDLTNNVENNWLKYASDLMIGKAGRKLAGPVRDQFALAEFEKLEAQGTNRLLIESLQHEQINRALQMGGKD